MPFDDRILAAGTLIRPRRSMRPVALWLFGICAMLLVMIALGGATRLTGAGLSIMEWAPLSGILPPLSHAEWVRLFALYKTIPQYALENTGMDLAGFQHIFWLEWTHRLWGRLIGLAVAGPLLWFWATGRIGRSLAARLGLFILLGGLQGAVGWFMVASGFFPDATAVSPYRLVAHLVLALALYVAILWTALDLWREAAPAGTAPRLVRRLLACAALLVGLTIVAGGFVAGNHAGLDYNTFPLMDGRLVPAGYARLTPWARNLFENVAAVQFDHRLLATLSVAACLACVAAGLRARVAGAVRAALAAVGVAVLAQYALGIATLLLVVPVGLATLHQAVAVLLLSTVVVALHVARPARGPVR